MKHKNISLVIGSLMGIALIAAPSMTFAAKGGNGVGKALGHLTAPGWIKNFGGGDNKNGGDNDRDDDGGHRNNPATTTGVVYSPGNMPPVISGVSSPTVLGVGATGTWSVSASDPQNGSLSYSVNWGDNGVQPQISAQAQTVFTQTSTFTHAYSAPGTYTVIFTVTDSAGLTSNSSVTVHVTRNGTTANPPVIGNLTATSSSRTRGRVSWTTDQPTMSKVWYSAVSPVDTSGTPAITRNTRTTGHTASLTGLMAGTTYYVVVQATDKAGLTSTSSASFTTVSAPTSGLTITSFTGPTSIPALQQGIWTMNASDPSNSSLSYAIDWGDTGSQSQFASQAQTAFTQTSTFTHTYANPGTYTVTVTAQNSAGLTASATTAVTVTAATGTNPLSLSNVSESVASTSVNLTWDTNLTADSQILYSTSSPVLGGSQTQVIVDGSSVTSHSINVIGLTPNTQYFFVIESIDGAGDKAATSEFSTTTPVN